MVDFSTLALISPDFISERIVSTYHLFILIDQKLLLNVIQLTKILVARWSIWTLKMLLKIVQMKKNDASYHTWCKRDVHKVLGKEGLIKY